MTRIRQAWGVLKSKRPVAGEGKGRERGVFHVVGRPYTAFVVTLNTKTRAGVGVRLLCFLLFLFYFAYRKKQRRFLSFFGSSLFVKDSIGKKKANKK